MEYINGMVNRTIKERKKKFKRKRKEKARKI